MKASSSSVCRRREGIILTANLYELVSLYIIPIPSVWDKRKKKKKKRGLTWRNAANWSNEGAVTCSMGMGEVRTEINDRSGLKCWKLKDNANLLGYFYSFSLSLSRFFVRGLWGWMRAADAKKVGNSELGCS